MKRLKLRIMKMILAAFLMTVLTVGNAESKDLRLHHATGFESTAELKMHIEDWMISDRIWHLNEISFNVEVESDNAMMLAPWMLDVNQWTRLAPTELLVTEREVRKGLEAWMVDVHSWNRLVPLRELNSTEEIRQAIEVWMIDQHYWN